MGQFINEVARINQNANHKMKISEERDFVRNALYKRIYREFRECEDIDDTYNYLANLHTKTKICYEEHNFGTHVTMDFIDTTYYRQLKKIYKIFQEHEKTLKIQEEKGELSTLYIVFDEKNRMDTQKTYELHAKKNIPNYVETLTDKVIKHYTILDRNQKPYDFKIYYFKDMDVIDLMTTTNTLMKDGLLDGIKLQTLSPFHPINLLFIIPLIFFLAYIGFHVLIAMILIIFVLIIVFCG